MKTVCSLLYDSSSSISRVSPLLSISTWRVRLNEKVVTCVTVFSAVSMTQSSRTKSVAASKDCILKARMPCKVIV